MSKPYSKEKFLKEVADELHDVKQKWKLIGTQLEVPQSRLKAIEQKHKDELELALIETINEWLNQILDGDPSWSGIIGALQSRSVDEHGLARNLKLRKCKNSSPQADDDDEPGEDTSGLAPDHQASQLLVSVFTKLDVTVKMVIKWEIVNNKKLIIIIILIGGSTIVMLIYGTEIYSFITRRAVVSPRFNHNMYLIRTPEFRCYDVNYDSVMPMNNTSAGNFKLPSIKSNPECSNEICHQHHQPDGSSIFYLKPIAQCTTAAIPNPGESEFIHTRLFGADLMGIGIGQACEYSWRNQLQIGCVANPFAVLVFIFIFILLAPIYYLLIFVFLPGRRRRHRNRVMPVITAHNMLL